MLDANERKLRQLYEQIPELYRDKGVFKTAVESYCESTDDPSTVTHLRVLDLYYGLSGEMLSATGIALKLGVKRSCIQDYRNRGIRKLRTRLRSHMKNAA